MSLFTITLHCGRDLRATEQYQSDTYEGGLALGRHSSERVHKKIEIQTMLAKRIIPGPVHAIVPPDLGTDERGWCLPMFTVITWFVSEPMQDPQNGGSHLAVILFQDTTYPPLSPENAAALKNLAWDCYAEDFNY